MMAPMIVPPFLAAGSLEAVVFKSKTGEGAYLSFALSRAGRGSRSEEASVSERGKLVKRVSAWRLWLTDLSAAGAPTPKIGDQIVDAEGRTYVVAGVGEALFGYVFNLDTYEMLT